MFVSAPISEIHELNQNKKKNSNWLFQFNTFLGITQYGSTVYVGKALVWPAL